MSRMRRLLDTIRGRIQRRGDQDNDADRLQPAPPLPLLPAGRRPITPPATTAAEGLVAALGNFARLPPELRRRVLVTAFGDRTLHLDLRLAPRGQQPIGSPWSEDEYEHGCGWAPLSWSLVVMDGGVQVPAKDLVWEWRCRDLLNALLGHSDRNPLTPNVGRQLLLSQRLADIRSLELGLDVLLFGDIRLPLRSRGDEKEKMRQLPRLAGLVATFPNLRSLVISFSDNLYNDWNARPMARLPEIERLLLQPLALAVAPLASQQEKHVVVEFPSNVFQDLKGLGLEEEQRGDEWMDGKGVWLRYPIGDSFFYYIKKGVESDLIWGHDDTPQSKSATVAYGLHTAL
ncbi:hypothetical protein E8E14_007605 [Neopestalotiopsis sp. 37M]|nr:hypothetical protein E8E14_007605 [Neopestalotiopsis sp. 37M]